MRVISGQFKGRRLIAPKLVKPTEEKVRKALFDILMHVIKGSRFLDLYAGCGGVGIEALSRGACQVYFVEKDYRNAEIIEQNINNLKIPLKSYSILTADAGNIIPSLANRKEEFGFIYLDPPYYQEMAKKALQMLGAYDILTQNGFIIVQHHRKDKLLEEFGQLRLWRTNSYSTTLLSFYAKRASLYFE